MVAQRLSKHLHRVAHVGRDTIDLVGCLLNEGARLLGRGQPAGDALRGAQQVATLCIRVEHPFAAHPCEQPTQMVYFGVGHRQCWCVRIAGQFYAHVQVLSFLHQPPNPPINLTALRAAGYGHR